MDGYSLVFDKAIKTYENVEDKQKLFKEFRTNFLIYGFIDNGDRPPDIEADTIARITNPKLYSEYRDFIRLRKSIGYSTPPKHEYSNLDSRHLMMFVILFTNIKDTINTVVEIGGGFGNWRTCNQDIPSWTIIDLPHVGQLQKWFLDEQLVESYNIISAFDYESWACDKTFDLVIGTHSLSEFSLEIFTNYFEKVVKKSKYFFYAYHNTKPTPELINAKLEMIRGSFNEIVNVQSENGNVSNCLFLIK
jgi:hypothetical protein